MWQVGVWVPAGVHPAGAREEARPGQPGLLPWPFLDWPGGHAQLRPLQRGPPAAAPSTIDSAPPKQGAAARSWRPRLSPAGDSAAQSGHVAGGGLQRRAVRARPSQRGC